MKQIFWGAAFFTACVSAAANTGQHNNIDIPAITINQDSQLIRHDFTRQVYAYAAPMNIRSGASVLGIAPLGGTKVTAFKELGLDGLVIIDWDRPGTPDSAEKNFTDAAQRELLIASLTESLNNGSMNTATVMQSTITAQILARLSYELDVTTVRIQYFLPKNFSRQSSLELWNGNPVNNEDTPLLMKFSFEYNGSPKELVFVSAKITSDDIQWRNALPVDVLNDLAPQKYDWGYLSADGLIFFSAMENNGLNKGDQELLDLLTPAGNVILDYPHADIYTKNPQIFDGLTGMRGRGDLEKWGLIAIANIPAKGARVFGYSGLAPEDEVRIYQKPGSTATKIKTSDNDIFSMKSFTQVGEDYIFDMHHPACENSPSARR